MPDFADPDTWEVVLVRCPRCEKTVVTDRRNEHIEGHYLLQIGDYITRDLQVVEGRAQADGLYIGKGRAKFWNEDKMRFVGMHKKDDA